MQNYVRQAKITWCKQLAAVLHNLANQCELSNEFQDLGPEDQFFNDSCKIVQFRHNIHELGYTLENMSKYMSMIEEGR